MKNLNRVRRNGGKKGSSSQAGSKPENSPGETQGVSPLAVIVSCNGKSLGEFTLPIEASTKLRAIASQHYEGRVESVIEGAVETRLGGFEKAASVPQETVTPENPGREYNRRLDEMEFAIRQAAGLCDMLLHRVLHPDDEVRYLGKQAEAGWMELSIQTFDRLLLADNAIRQFSRGVIP